jgi:hypothetical protein
MHIAQKAIMTGIIAKFIFVPKDIPGPPRAIECADGVSDSITDGTAGGGGVDESTTTALANGAGFAEGWAGFGFGLSDPRCDIIDVAVLARARMCDILKRGLMLGGDVYSLKRRNVKC